MYDVKEYNECTLGTTLESCSDFYLEVQNHGFVEGAGLFRLLTVEMQMGQELITVQAST